MSRPGQNRGVNNVKAKLGEAEVTEIYLSTDKTIRALADHYGVTQSTINHIRAGRTWVWLTSKLGQR